MNKSQIARALREAVFTPNKLGPMKIIADVGNTNYYVRRATEFLTLSLTALTRDQRVKYFDSALGLIALAKVKTQEQNDITIGNINRAVTTPLKIDTKKVLVKEQNEMDIEKQGRQICCARDDFLQEPVSGGVRNFRSSDKIEEQVPEEIQLWPETLGYPSGYATPNGARRCPTKDKGTESSASRPNNKTN